VSKAQIHPPASDRAALLDLLKKVAKHEKKANPGGKLATYQDAVAKAIGYLNWSMLHKHVAQMTQPQFGAFSALTHANPQVQKLSKGSANVLAPTPLDEEAAKEEMREWVRATYTPLVEFAPLDNESDTGFAFPDEDLLNDLQEEFDQRFPYEWIEDVAGDMDGEGPWGLPGKFDDDDRNIEPENASESDDLTAPDEDGDPWAATESNL
jgi:hypothetical protein